MFAKVLQNFANSAYCIYKNIKRGILHAREEKNVQGNTPYCKCRVCIWFVCAKNKIEARKIIIDKTGCGIVEFPDYQGIPERYKHMEYGEAKKYEYARGKFI